MNSLEIIDPEYRSEYHSAYHLYLEFSECGASALIVDPQSLKNLKFVSKPEISAEDFCVSLGEPNFKQVLCSLKTKNASLVPMAEFKAEEVNSYLSFANADNFDNKDIRWDSLSEPEANVCYATSKALIETLEARYSSISIGNHASFFIYLATLEKSNSEHAQVFVNQAEDAIDICVFQQSKLLFYNRFKAFGKHDVLYHLMNCLDIFELKPEEIRLELSGFIDSVEQEGLRKFVKHVHERDSDPRLQSCEEMNKNIRQEYHSLFQLHLCE